MKGMKDLAEELEKEVGADLVAMAEVIDDDSSSREGVIESGIPVTDSGDVVLGIMSVDNPKMGELVFLALVHEKGMRTYVLDETEVDGVVGEISSMLENREIYTTSREIDEFQGNFFPVTSAKIHAFDDRSRRLMRGLNRRALMMDGSAGGMSTMISRFMEHMFTLYHMYLRVKQDAKNINYGKYKVKVQI